MKWSSAVLVILFCIPGLLFASAPTAFDGWYAGLGVGVHNSTNRINTTVGSTAGNGSSLEPDPFSTRLSMTKPDGDIFLGYGKSSKRFYFGAEAGVDIANTHQEDVAFFRDIGTNQELKSSNSVDLGDFRFHMDLRPGILLAPSTLLFGQIGFAVARLSLSSSASYADNLVAPVETSTDRQKTNIGFRAGIGIARKITNHLMLRLNYIVTLYHRNAIESANGANTITQSVEVTPVTQAVLLSLAYHFNGMLGKTSKFFSKITKLTSTAFNGFYVGAGGGVSSVSYQANINSGTAAVANELRFIRDARFTKTPILGNVFFGYGHLWKKRFLGVEISTHMGSRGFDVNTTLKDNPNIEILTSENSFILSSFSGNFDVLPGVLLSPTTLIFGRLGIAVARLKMNSSADFADRDTGPATAFVSASQSKVLAGLRLGLGITQNLTRCIALRLDYSATWYPTSTFSRSAAMSGAAGSIDFTSSAKPREQTTMLDFIYRFK